MVEKTEMPFHVPFNQRASQQRNLEPIYIGFEAPLPPRPRFNWWGFNGMWMSMASFATLGFLSVIPLMISLVGLRRPGKKMATVGTVFSLIGLTLAGTILTTGIAEHRARAHRHQQAVHRKVVKQQIGEAKELIGVAVEDLIEYRGKNDGVLPGDIEGNVMVVGYVDPWGQSLRYELENDKQLVRSAGPDAKFLTGDDLSQPVKGRVVREPKHVPVSTNSAAN